jgi:hypothetical protein
VTVRAIENSGFLRASDRLGAVTGVAGGRQTIYTLALN